MVAFKGHLIRILRNLQIPDIAHPIADSELAQVPKYIPYFCAIRDRVTLLVIRLGLGPDSDI